MGSLGLREDLTYQQTVRKHFLSSVATLETVSQNRERLLRDFYNYRASAIDEGKKGKTKSYVIPPQAGIHASFCACDVW